MEPQRPGNGQGAYNGNDSWGRPTSTQGWASAGGSTEDAEAVQTLAAACNRFEKKLSDLDLSRTVATQMAPQIRLVQNNEMRRMESELRAKLLEVR